MQPKMLQPVAGTTIGTSGYRCNPGADRYAWRRIRSLKLKKYPTSLEQPDDWLELVHSHSDSVYILQSGLRNKESTAPTHHSIYRAERGEYRLEPGQAELVVPLYWNENGIEVVKKLSFPTR